MTPWLDNAMFAWIEHGRGKKTSRDPKDRYEPGVSAQEANV